MRETPLSEPTTNKSIDNNSSLNISQQTTKSESNNSVVFNHIVEKNNHEGNNSATTPSLYLKLPNIIDAKKPNMLAQQSYTEIKEESIDTKISSRKPVNTEETFYRSPEEKINTALLPPQLEEIKEKSIIKIETHEVNSIQYLKEKFDKTHNIVFALALAEDYYANKNYKESNKWALIANNIDAENEKSWIIFAKTKFKLGQKEDAIRALEAYLKTNKSKSIQSLVHHMSIGENID